MSKYNQFMEDIAQLKQLPISLLLNEEQYLNPDHPFFGLGQNERLALLHQVYCIHADEVLADEECLIEMEDHQYFALGSLGMIKAGAKCGKTQCATALCAAILKGEDGLWSLKGLKPDATIIYFDTEQSMRETQNVKRRILDLAGMTDGEAAERLTVVNLRPCSPEQRIAEIDYAIKTFRPQFAMVDGVVDLCSNFNDATESSRIIGKLMAWSLEYKCFIFNIIHTNPSGDGNNKGRGHLGTILEQKASDVLELRRSPTGIFTVTSKISRGIPMPSWSFRFTADGQLEAVSETVVTKEEKKEEGKQQVAAFITQLLQATPEKTMMRSDVHRQIMSHLNIGKTTADTRINEVKHLFECGTTAGRQWVRLKPQEPDVQADDGIDGTADVCTTDSIVCTTDNSGAADSIESNATTCFFVFSYPFRGL